ncbi:helix-turn-helix transcriptional regulator [Brucella anthropi]|uniref:Helix-turn-helix transcriptional regulator n=1 Tax=Brucella anthropi TaxID=529 RepID=A0A6I0DKC6_BRUAN|nr:helix-turn-helix domain-containing protein [Brucella anthropi]KAB2790330.1 helix-turn-helix transcriptional regulator [Brucella anthropi]
MTAAKPFGRDATTAALLNAADELFGAKGPNAVTVREISARANVNHALMHRHFGSKEALLDAIIDKHMVASKEAIYAAANPDEAISNLLNYLNSEPAFPRIFAHLILDRRPLKDFVRKSGGTADLATLLERIGLVPAEARATAATLTAFAFGWALFKDLTAYAASCEEPPGQLDGRAVAMLTGILHRIAADPQDK